MNGWLFSEEEIGRHPTLIGREQKFSDYAAFTEKFKGKKTTDDCYTPNDVYEAVKKWVSENVLKLDGVEIVRPFYPGGDYERFRYPANCVVLDNPPFSQLAKIRRFYAARWIRYFLFAPTLTLFGTVLDGECFIVCGSDITYENGAKVATSFITNMICDGTLINVCGSLSALLNEIDDVRKAKKKNEDIVYPDCVVNAARLSTISVKGVDLKICSSSAQRISALDEQRKRGKGIFGGGLLLSLRATNALKQAQAKAQAKVYALSPREEEIQRGLI